MFSLGAILSDQMRYSKGLLIFLGSNLTLEIIISRIASNAWSSDTEINTQGTVWDRTNPGNLFQCQVRPKRWVA